MNGKYTSISQLAKAAFDSVNPVYVESQSALGNSVMVWERLRLILTRFAGTDGFTALFRCALSVARVDNPSIAGVGMRPDGSITGIDQLNDAQAAALATCLLEMLVTLIGERLTLHLVREAWPELMNEMHGNSQ